MIRASAPALGWGVFVAGGLATSAGSVPIQLGFAAAAIGGLGLAHGASDLAVVAPEHRRGFLVVYGVAIVACLALWLATPMLALVGFLLLSAIHFGLDDAPADRPIERIVRGVLMIAGPAVFHRRALDDILTVAGGSAAPLASVLQYAGVLALAALPLLISGRWRAGELGETAMLGVGAVFLVALPPLVGFTLGFVLLHARPQTAGRMAELGCLRLRYYVLRVMPVLGGAVVVVAGIAVIFRGTDPSGLRMLFAAIAALAVPHMLVTPLFRRDRQAGTTLAAPA